MSKIIEIEVFEFTEKTPPLDTDIQVFDIYRKCWIPTQMYKNALSDELCFSGFFIRRDDLSHWWEIPKLEV